MSELNNIIGYVVFSLLLIFTSILTYQEWRIGKNEGFDPFRVISIIVFLAIALGSLFILVLAIVYKG